MAVRRRRLLHAGAREAIKAVTDLRRQVPGGPDGGLDPLHRALVGSADGGGLLCRGAQLVGVVLEVGGPVFEDLQTIKTNDGFTTRAAADD